MTIHRDWRAGLALILAALFTTAACRSHPESSSSASEAAATGSHPLPDPLPDVAARVNGEPVLTRNVKLLGEVLLHDGKFTAEQKPEAYRRALDRFIERELLLQEALGQGLSADQKRIEQAEDKLHADYPDEKKWQDYLARQGFDPQSFRTELRAQYTVATLLQRTAVSPEDITDGEVADYYNAHVAEATVAERYKARHILIRVPPDVNMRRKGEFKTEAEQILVEAKTGGDFVVLAQKHSEDEATAPSGGLLPVFGKGELDPRLAAVEAAVAKLQPGRVSDVIESEEGFHIVKLEERLPGGVRSLPNMAPGIRQKLASEKQAALRAELIRRLRAKAKIETYL
jgi:parvulin-like peptidyl-prolyl isomerase